MSEQPKSGQDSSPSKWRGDIFISYRRDDTAGFAGRLYDRLSTHFPKHGIFMDVDSIGPGTDFIEAIKESVGASEVMIALIGKRWVTSSDEGGIRRLVWLALPIQSTVFWPSG
jgi:hypothetical protein